MATPKKIRPLADRIVVEPKEAETKTAGGILIPDTAGKEKPAVGTVISVGPGKYVDGKVHPVQVKVGDSVVFGKYAGTNFNLEKEYLVLREEDVIGVLE